MVKGLAEEGHRRIQFDHLKLRVPLAQDLSFSVALEEVQLRNRVQRQHSSPCHQQAAKDHGTTTRPRMAAYTHDDRTMSKDKNEGYIYSPL